MIWLFGRICGCRAFSYLIPTMDSIIEAIANRLRIRGDAFHPCNSQFQWFDGLTMSGFILNRYAPFITGISPFQSFQAFHCFALFQSFQTVSLAGNFHVSRIPETSKELQNIVEAIQSNRHRRFARFAEIGRCTAPFERRSRGETLLL